MLSMNISHVQPLTRIKCKTVYQPYASSFAAGLKTIETNQRPAEKFGLRRGDLLAIHAGKRKMTAADWDLATATGVNKHWPLEQNVTPKFGIPPYGAIVCVVRYLRSSFSPVPTGDGESWVDALPEMERALGDYSPGRYGWRCELVKTFDTPIPAKGAQGVFWIDMPANWWE